MNNPSVAIIGAGLCGTLLSIYLAKNGMTPEVFEYRPDIRKLDNANGRSINMALSHRGIHALKKAGVFESVFPELIPMKGRMVHALDGEMNFQPYGVSNDQVIYSISRKRLNEILMNYAEGEYGVSFRFETKCVEVANHQITFSDGQKQFEEGFHYIFGTDGAFSKVRASMMKHDRFNYAQNFIPQGYKELSIKSLPNGKFQLEKNALHIWPRKNFMLIALPNVDGSFTCTLFLDFEGSPSFSTLKTESDVKRFFQEHFPDAYECMGGVEQEFFQNPTNSLVTISCSPWNVSNHTLLLGDAAHAIVPFFGQGMNASFEDVRLLFDFIDQNQTLDQAIEKFTDLRKPDTDAIAKMALENFVEMRDHVVNPMYLKKRRLEQTLEKDPTSNFQSRYTMVSFTDIPYAQVYEKGLQNQKILETLVKK